MATDKIGLSVFNTKRAESEPWLMQHAFVSPPDFEFLKGDHSIVLFGEPGTGKTASCLALEQYGLTSSKRLIVHWNPQMPENVTEVSTALAVSQLKDILGACARNFINQLSLDPALLLKAIPSAQEYLIWFLKHVTSAKELQSLLLDSTSKKDKDQFQVLFERYSRDFFREPPDTMVIATEFTKALISTGFTGVWIMVDGIEWLTENQRKNAINALHSILSTIKLFEIPYLSYKMVLPIEFESDLANAIAITRDRAMVFRISWDTNYLAAILEQRLSLAVGNSSSLDSLYKVEEIQSWLETCGGLTPRGWLEYFRPIFSTYWDILSSGKPRKLTKTEWVNARKRSSLHLKFDPGTNQVWVGMGEMRILSPEVGAIFSYLYNNQGRYCTKKELYYQAYLPFSAPQAKNKEINEPIALPKEYDDLINTVIYRLRQAVEPNPKDKEPAFITTKRDVGIRLSIQAFK